MKSLQPEPFPQSIVNIPLHRVSPSPASLCKFSEKCPLTGAYELGQSASQKVSIRVRRRPYSHKLKYQKFDTDLISTQLSLLKGYCSEFVLISKSDIANKNSNSKRFRHAGLDAVYYPTNQLQYYFHIIFGSKYQENNELKVRDKFAATRFSLLLLKAFTYIVIVVHLLLVV